MSEIFSSYDFIPLDVTITENANKNPKKIAIEKGEQKISYQELETYSNAIANLLADHLGNPNSKIKPEQSRIVIFGKSSPDFIAAMLAILKYGGIIIPINPLLPLQRIHLMLDVSFVNGCINPRKNGEELTRARFA